MPTQPASLERSRLMPERARIWHCRFKGQWSAYFETSTCTIAPSVDGTPFELLRNSVWEPGRRAFDQMRDRRRLGDAIGARPAGIFGPDGDNPRLRGHDIEPLSPVLADPVYLAAAAGAERACGLDHLLDPGAGSPEGFRGSD